MRVLSDSDDGGPLGAADTCLVDEDFVFAWREVLELIDAVRVCFYGTAAREAVARDLHRGVGNRHSILIEYRTGNRARIRRARSSGSQHHQDKRDEQLRQPAHRDPPFTKSWINGNRNMPRSKLR